MKLATKVCDRCQGTGRVQRQQRRLADGSFDAFDIVGRSMATCDPCGGSGEVPAATAVTVERKPGYAADF